MDSNWMNKTRSRRQNAMKTGRVAKYLTEYLLLQVPPATVLRRAMPAMLCCAVFQVLVRRCVCVLCVCVWSRSIHFAGGQESSGLFFLQFFFSARVPEEKTRFPKSGWRLPPNVARSQALTPFPH